MYVVHLLYFTPPKTQLPFYHCEYENKRYFSFTNPFLGNLTIKQNTNIKTRKLFPNCHYTFEKKKKTSVCLHRTPGQLKNTHLLVFSHNNWTNEIHIIFLMQKWRFNWKLRKYFPLHTKGTNLKLFASCGSSTWICETAKKRCSKQKKLSSTFGKLIINYILNWVCWEGWNYKDFESFSCVSVCLFFRIFKITWKRLVRENVENVQ